MLEIKFIRKNLSEVQEAVAARNMSVDFDTFLNSDTQRKAVLLKMEELKHLRNTVTDEIAQLKKAGEETENLIGQMRKVSTEIKDMEKSLTKHEKIIEQILFEIPNIPHSSVKLGKESADNPVIKQVGEIRKFNFEPKPHWTLGSDLGIFDFERASRITGARFPLYFGAGARLERALMNFMLDMHTIEHGYTEILPPFAVNRASMTHTGQLPKFEEDLFKLEGWDYFLIPTAEVPVTNIHHNEILESEDLPIYYTAHTPCFRSEAGSYGKDTRGLIRQHQFNKVELVKFSHPDSSYDELEKLLRNAETVLKRLDLPYQVVNLCSGDLGFSSAKTYDIEVWMPSQNVYREISSCSNFESFQARRGNIRFKEKGKKGTRLVHTLNGSGLAVGRTVAAILENNQQEDGSIIIPDLLRPYMNGLENISK